MISSIRRAAARLPKGASAIVSLVDVPEIEPWWIERLLRAARDDDEILIPRFDDGDGHPVFLTPRGLARLGEDLPLGLKSLIERAGPRARRIEFGGLRPLDCDTPEAYTDLRIRHARAFLDAPAPRPYASVLSSLAVLLGVAGATGFLAGRPILADGEANLFHLFWGAALAGFLRGLLDDRGLSRDLLPLSLAFLLLGAVRLHPYPGISAYLLETLYAGLLLACYEATLLLGRSLRNPPGRILEIVVPLPIRFLLLLWWLGLLPPFVASLYTLERLEEEIAPLAALIFSIPPFLFAGGWGLFLALAAPILLARRSAREVARP
jgi:hypothetical protein